MLKHDIGFNAGIIWRLLNEKGSLSIREIGEYTHFQELLIYYSLGWLARENRIGFFEKGDSVHVGLVNSYTEMYF
jgi:hypothetical protein